MENIKENNKRLVERYPLLLPCDWVTGEALDGYDYSYTLLDDMPDGWRIAFGAEMIEDLRDILIRHDCLDSYRVYQIKEKFGTLRWNGSYFAEFKEDFELWRDKYVIKSAFTCIDCGKPATRITTDYISPFCETCVKRHEKNYKKLPSPDKYYGIEKY